MLKAIGARTEATLLVTIVALCFGCAAPAANNQPGSSAPFSNCPNLAFEPVPTSPVPVSTSVGTPIQVGVALRAGNLDWLIDTLRIDVMSPGVHIVDTPPSGPPAGTAADYGSFTRGTEPHVRRFTRSAIRAADLTVIYSFDGRDERGAAVAPGDYEVALLLAYSATPGAPCLHGGVGGQTQTAGILTRIHY